MTLENSVRDVISQKLQDGTVEKLVAEQLEKGITKALENLFGSFGDVTKVIEKQVKSVMVPYIEQHDFSEYLVKLDSVMVDVLKATTADNAAILQNFKYLMLPEDRKEIKATELFDIWCKFVAKEVETDGLAVQYDDGVRYESVEGIFEVSCADDRNWSCFENATLVLECEHDKNMNFAARIYRFRRDGQKEWTIQYDNVKDLSSLRRLNEFEILLMRLSHAGTKLILDRDCLSEEIRPEKEPEARFE